MSFRFQVRRGTRDTLLAFPFFVLSTALVSRAEKCVIFAFSFVLLPKPRRSCFKTVLMGYFRPVPSGPRPRQQRCLDTTSTRLYYFLCLTPGGFIC